MGLSTHSGDPPALIPQNGTSSIGSPPGGVTRTRTLHGIDRTTRHVPAGLPSQAGSPRSWIVAASPGLTPVENDRGRPVVAIGRRPSLSRRTWRRRRWRTGRPRPSGEAGASLVVDLGTPGPVITGTTKTVSATLLSASAAPIANYPIKLTIGGANLATRLPGKKTLANNYTLKKRELQENR